MNNAQFRVLYRQFLFRIVDLEVLSPQAQGDASRLLGLFATLLVFISFWLGLAGILADFSGQGSGALVFGMIVQHFQIATTMLAVGLFAVLSWDATFPDRRDVMVLAPLPVRARTIFLAKVSAVATALGLTIGLLHSGMGLTWPAAFAIGSQPAALPALSLDPTPFPVAARDLQDVMNRDLKQALTSGDLMPGTGVGMAIGVWEHGERRVFSYGAAKPDSLFEIGSISKTFTGLMLARMVAEGKARLDQPVRELLPAGTVEKPAGPEITLLDLATHHSGLPEFPDNIHPADRSNPFADYGPQQLYAWLGAHGTAKRADAGYLYSSLGMGLLGQALAERAGRSYAEELRAEITAPLGITDTVVKLSAAQQARFPRGHDAKHRPVSAWDLDALAGAGAIRSTAEDMTTYLEANLHGRRYSALSGALALSHRLRDNAGADNQISLAWLYSARTGTYQHSGATAGFTSTAFFNPGSDFAAVVLMNAGPNRLDPVSPD